MFNDFAAVFAAATSTERQMIKKEEINYDEVNLIAGNLYRVLEESFLNIPRNLIWNNVGKDESLRFISKIWIFKIIRSKMKFQFRSTWSKAHPKISSLRNTVSVLQYLFSNIWSSLFNLT